MNPTPEQIKTARSSAGLSQAKAADLLHVTLAGWQHWEYGKRKMHPAFWELLQIKIDALQATGKNVIITLTGQLCPK